MIYRLAAAEAARIGSDSPDNMTASAATEKTRA
jgi:hypothetical protein